MPAITGSIPDIMDLRASCQPPDEDFFSKITALVTQFHIFHQILQKKNPPKCKMQFL